VGLLAEVLPRCLREFCESDQGTNPMLQFALPDRLSLAHKLAAQKMLIARQMTNAIFARHPELEQRYGTLGRVKSDDDGCFHIDFLAGSLVAGSVQAFEDYIHWTTGVLAARGLGADAVQESLLLMEGTARELLLPEEFSVVQTYMSAGRKACLLPPSGDAAESKSANIWQDLMLAFRTAVLSGQRQAALYVVDEAQNLGADLLDIYEDIIAESLHSIGFLWAGNQANVAQEHMASSVVQYVIAILYTRIQRPASSRGNMVVTGVRGEQHQIGLSLVADAMESQGWNVRFLGSNLPHSTILEQVRDFAQVVCISTTLIANLPATAELISLLCSNLSNKTPKIILGGAAIRLAPEFVQEYGPVLAVHNLREAINLLEGSN